MKYSGVLFSLLFFLVSSGCATHPKTEWRRHEAMNKEDSGFSESLAHFAQALIARKLDGETSDETLSHLTSAVNFNPDSYCLQSELARSLISKGSPDQAIKKLEKYCRKHPTNIDARIDLARICAWSGNPDKAIKHYSKAISIKAPESSATHLAVANLYCQEGQKTQAIATLNEALQKFPDDLLVLSMLGYIYVEDNALNEMENSLRKIEEICLKTGEEKLPVSLYTVFASIIYRSGNTAKATEILKKCIERYPSSQEALGMLGCIYIDEKQFEEAEKAFHLITQNNSTNNASLSVNFYLVYAETCYRAGHTDKSREALEQCLKLYPEALEILIMLGCVYAETERPEQAEHVFECVANAPNQGTNNLPVEFYLAYGETCHNMKLTEKAENIFEQCINLYPSAHQALNYLAYTWAENGFKLDKALEYIKRALESEPDNAAYLDTLGWIYYKQAKFNEALEQIEKANNLLPDDPTILDHLGDIASVLNHIDKAIDCWKQSFLLDPKNSSVSSKLTAHGIDIDGLLREQEKLKDNTEQKNKD